MLDNLSDGRFILGIGRGLAKVEYDGFRVDMNESRTGSSSRPSAS